MNEDNFQIQIPGGLYSEGLIIGSIFAFQIWGSFDTEGLIHGGAYFRNFTVWH